MDGTSLPPGFRFHPTDEELVGYYLRRKVDGLEIELEVIPAIDLYKFDPWELPDKSFLPKRDMEWYFFCPRDRKYLNGSRTNRATAAGYWKATGKDKKIVCNHAVTGLRKTLVFYRGRAPSGDRTDWVMHEYRLCGDSSQGSSCFVGSFSLCRIVKKSEQGLKIGESHGESKTRSIVSSMKRSLTSRIFKNKVLRASGESPPPASDLYDESNSSTPITSPKIHSTMKPELNSTESSYASIWVPHEMVSDASEVIAQAGDHASDCILPNEFQNSGTSWQPSNPIFSPFPSYFVEEFNPADDLGQIECMSCYPKSMNCSGVTSNGNTEVQSLKWAESSPGDINPMTDGFEAWNLAISPQICRQASGDGCHGELNSLCGQKMTTC